MKKALLAFIAILILGALLIIVNVIWHYDKQSTITDITPKVEVISEKDKMLDAFTFVNKAIPRINQINKGRITSEFSGFFMLAGKEVKEETTIEKTFEGLNNKTTVTYFDGTTELFEAVSDRTVSDIVYMQWYPKEEIKKEYFDTAEKLTINRNKDSTEFRIDWKQDEIKASPNIYLQYLYSYINVDKNGYITDWSFYAKSYEKDAEGNKVNVTDSTAIVKLSDYSD